MTYLLPLPAHLHYRKLYVFDGVLYFCTLHLFLLPSNRQNYTGVDKKVILILFILNTVNFAPKIRKICEGKMNSVVQTGRPTLCNMPYLKQNKTKNTENY